MYKKKIYIYIYDECSEEIYVCDVNQSATAVLRNDRLRIDQVLRIA